MLDPKSFLQQLELAGIRVFTGVPDSLMAGLIARIVSDVPVDRHIVAANEGNAVAIAAGRYLGTGDLAAVYLQNSGLGNVVNPLQSLAAPAVYGIPMVLLVGWRGEPGRPDEPQHEVAGRSTEAILHELGIPAWVLPGEEADANERIRYATSTAKRDRTPVALLVRRETFMGAATPEVVATSAGGFSELARADAIALVAEKLSGDEVVVCTTGYASRELVCARVERSGAARELDFLCVGSMGHASQIALGLAVARPHRVVYCVDGDGALLMHLGGLATIADCAPKNFRHVVLNNGCHQSVGGVRTAAAAISLAGVAAAVGYSQAWSTGRRVRAVELLRTQRDAPGPNFLELIVARSAETVAGRPATTPRERADTFIQALQ